MNWGHNYNTDQTIFSYILISFDVQYGTLTQPNLRIIQLEGKLYLVHDWQTKIISNNFLNRLQELASKINAVKEDR